MIILNLIIHALGINIDKIYLLDIHVLTVFFLLILLLALVEHGLRNLLTITERNGLVETPARPRRQAFAALWHRSRVAKGGFEATFFSRGGHHRRPSYLTTRVPHLRSLFLILLRTTFCKQVKFLLNALDLTKSLIRRSQVLAHIIDFWLEGALLFL